MDVILRIATATILMVITLGIILRPGPWRWSVCFVAAGLGVSAFVSVNSTGDILVPAQWSALWVLTNFLSKTIVVSVWLFVQCSFDDEFRFDKFRVVITLAWLAMIIQGIWRLKVGIDDPFGFATVIFALALMAHLIWTLLRDRDGDLRLRRRTSRIWVSTIMISLLLMDLIIDLTLGFSWRPAGFVYVQNGLILLGVLSLAAVSMRIDLSALAPNLRPKDPRDEKRSLHATTLDKLMTTEQLYLRPDLRLSDVVMRLPLSEATTRTLIHTEFGQGHFRSFLNHYRIKHAQDLLRSPDLQDSKLIAIAFDSGFASLASFQRAFKRETGLTASQWRREYKA